MPKIHCICVAYERYEPLEILIRCFLIQTCPDWVLHIVYDGPAPQRIMDIIEPFTHGNRKDDRIHFYQSDERYQNYGHPNRRSMLQSIKCDTKDFILLSNDDNYYVPVFIEKMIEVAKPNTGIIYCNTVHSHMQYDINVSELKENFIDIGAFIVRSDVAKATGFNHDHFSADGRYAEECAGTCRARGLQITKIHKPYFIHN
jgi:hypothetical protein